MNVKAITLTYEQVASIIEEHINREVLKTPHHVTAVDPWDWDADNEHQFAVSLEPMTVTATPAVPFELTVTTYDPTIPVTLTNSQNGHHPVTAVTPVIATQEVAEPPTEPRKRRAPITDEQRNQVRALVLADTKRNAIASQVGIAESKVYDIIAELRAAGDLPQRGWSDDDNLRTKVYQLYEAGIPAQRIVERLGISHAEYSTIIEPAIRNKLVRPPAQPAVA